MTPIELILVGDVHGLWDDVDASFLEARGATAIFVGDYGDEDVALVERIVAIRATKVLTFGNHDAWHAMHGRGPREAVQRQLAAAGDAFIGYRTRLEPAGRPALLGTRPLPSGGGRHDRDFYGALAAVRSLHGPGGRISAPTAERRRRIAPAL